MGHHWADDPKEVELRARRARRVVTDVQRAEDPHEDVPSERMRRALRVLDAIRGGAREVPGNGSGRERVTPRRRR